MAGNTAGLCVMNLNSGDRTDLCLFNVEEAGRMLEDDVGHDMTFKVEGKPDLT